MFTYHTFSVSDQLAALIFPGLRHPVPTVPRRWGGAALLDLHLVTFKPSQAGRKAGMKQTEKASSQIKFHSFDYFNLFHFN